MTQTPQPPARDGEKEPNRRGIGPFLLVATGLLLLLILYGGSPGSSREINQDAFQWLLVSGRIEEVVSRPPTRFEGRFEADDGTLREFSVTVQDTASFEEPIRTFLGRELEPAITTTELRRSLTPDADGNRAITPLRAWPVQRREAGPADGGVQESNHFFLEYLDASGVHYTEVVGTDSRQLDLRGLHALVTEAGGRVEMPTVLNLEKGLRTEEGNSFLMYVLSTFFPILLFLALFWFLFMRQMRGQGQGLLSFGRSRAIIYNKENKTGVTFDDVAGIDEAKEEVSEIIEFLRNPTRFQRLGGRIPRGVLLVGPPGTGKTLLAKAIAGEADVPFLSISGSDFVEMFVGVGASRVRDLFKQAKESAPCIVFLDEIDAVGRKRGSGMGGGHDEREQTLNAILVEMDGFSTDEGIIVVAATNRPDVLDPALLRPGRFDREIVIDLPDVKGRQRILEVHTARVKTAQGVDLAAIARGTPGFSGAELAALVNEAAIQAVMRGHEAVTQEDFEEARDKVMFGRQKKSRVMDEADRRITAYHEAGHTLVACKLENTDPIHKVTIIPRGMALGATMHLPEKDRYSLSRRKLLDELAVLYGGRVAEEVFCEDITSGAANDIQRATRLARAMVMEWGMSDRVGPINFAERRGSEFLGTEVVGSKEHSDETARLLDQEISRLLKEAHDRARKIILAHRDDMERLAEALLLHETIHGDEVQRLLDGADPKDLRPQASAPPPPPPEPAPRTQPETQPGAFGNPGTEGLSPA